MTSRNDVDVLRGGISESVSLALRELEGLLGHLAGQPPEVIRDALLRSVPAITDMYGGMAAEIAADWYEDLRLREVGTSIRATTAAADPRAVEASVRYAAGPLFDDDIETTLSRLSHSVALQVADAGRNTVMRTAARDRARPRVAMVPTGARTCAWCLMLASRGWSTPSHVPPENPHSYCDCQRVVTWGKARIEGYDPDRLYRVYKRARDKSGSENPNKIVAAMRREFPDLVNDPVHE